MRRRKTAALLIAAPTNYISSFKYCPSFSNFIVLFKLYSPPRKHSAGKYKSPLQSNTAFRCSNTVAVGCPFTNIQPSPKTPSHSSSLVCLLELRFISQNLLYAPELRFIVQTRCLPPANYVVSPKHCFPPQKLCPAAQNPHSRPRTTFRRSNAVCRLPPIAKKTSEQKPRSDALILIPNYAFLIINFVSPLRFPQVCLCKFAAGGAPLSLSNCIAAARAILCRQQQFLIKHYALLKRGEKWKGSAFCTRGKLKNRAYIL